jgi:hypothetical protein
MANVRLNHKVVQQKMAEKYLRPIDLSGKLGVSPQMVQFILYKGGFKYAEKLSIIFDCRVSELLVTYQPVLRSKEHKLVNHKVRKKGV